MTERADRTEELDDEQLAQQLLAGNERALAELFARHQPRLQTIVQFRLDRRLYGRVDADDVLQEAYLGAASRLQHFRQESDGSVFIWLRLITSQTLAEVHRRHLGVQQRDAGREVSLHGSNHHSTSLSLVHHLLGTMTSPSQVVVRGETERQLTTAMDAMDEIDREVLALRHFEELTNQEVAEVLGISQKAASNRYVRALDRLRAMLAATPGFAPGA